MSLRLHARFARASALSCGALFLLAFNVARARAYGTTEASRDAGVASAGDTKEPGIDGGVTPAKAFGPPGPAIRAPTPKTPIAPKYPDAAMHDGIEGTVTLILSIDPEGTVTNVEVESGLPGGLSEAAVAAAQAARFQPAEDAEGRPTATRVRWLVQFTLPEKRIPSATATGSAVAGAANGATQMQRAIPNPAAEVEPLPPDAERVPLGERASWECWVRERGTGKDLPNATIYIEDAGELLHVDEHARASRRLTPGAYVVIIRAPGHMQEERIERLHAGERLFRVYFVEKERLNEYQSIVHAPAPRAEAGVVTLRAEEIHNIPGTFGDPFRTAMLLPGVGSVVSGLGYPVIRGQSPGETGTFIDDIKVPLLYHLGFGPAVVHPLYLDSLDFHPGNFPAEFGGFTGALVLAHTTAAPTEAQTMLSADLFKLSAFHQHPLHVADHEASVSASARYGTFAFLARAIDPRAVLEYWDYQARGDMKVAGGDLRLLWFGAQDTTGTSAGTDASGNQVPENLLRLRFHRLSVRFRRAWTKAKLDAAIDVGPDSFSTTEAAPTVGSNGQAESALTIGIREWIARPHVTTDWTLSSTLTLRTGVALLVQSWNTHLTSNDLPGALTEGLFPRYGLTPSAFLQAEWKPNPRWIVSPGVRADHYRYIMATETQTQTGVDPRLAVRFQLRPRWYLKAGTGIYRSPPRFLVPWPGLEGFGLNQGLNRSYQAFFGMEVGLPWDSTIDGQIYGNWMPHLSEFDFNVGGNDNGNGNTNTPQSVYRGRAYGLEIIARRRMGKRLFGWLTYTLGRSERDYPGAGWRSADFDQTQIINGVVSYAMGRAWTLSGVFHYNSGRPYSPTQVERSSSLADRNLNRLPDFWRVDLRIEKREAFETWYLDFYVDWLNISLQREATSWDSGRMQPQTILLTIPTIGLQATF